MILSTEASRALLTAYHFVAPEDYKKLNYDQKVRIMLTLDDLKWLKELGVAV